MGRYEELKNSHPDLIASVVECQYCRKSEKVDSAECFAKGWPKCCGYTMRLKSRRQKELRLITHLVDLIPTKDKPFRKVFVFPK